MTQKQPVSAKVNPMVGVKMQKVLALLEHATAQLKDGSTPLCTHLPEPTVTDKAKEAEAKEAARAVPVKFSDLYRAKTFLTVNELGTVDISMSGPIKSNPLLQRIVADYVAKDLTPNCSIQQVLDAGAKLSVHYKLSALGHEVLKARLQRDEESKDGTVKTKKVAAPKAAKAAKPKAERKARVAKPKAEKAVRVRKPKADAAPATARRTRGPNKPKVDGAAATPRRPRLQKAVEIKSADASAKPPLPVNTPATGSVGESRPTVPGDPTWS